MESKKIKKCKVKILTNVINHSVRESSSICRNFTPASWNTAAARLSMAYERLYTTSRIPHCTILTEHVRHGQLYLSVNHSSSAKKGNEAYVLQYKTEPSPPAAALSLPASNSAFSSACKHRQVSKLLPPTIPPLQRGQPPSVQFFIPRGVPL